jgi:hypothetical protein
LPTSNILPLVVNLLLFPNFPLLLNVTLKVFYKLLPVPMDRRPRRLVEVRTRINLPPNNLQRQINSDSRSAILRLRAPTESDDKLKMKTLRTIISAS